ncbi:MAG: hypothetical protein NT147_02740 [Candidatus Aminicenantes bacterium]|nr:hypothetical protein [Candidatus Aminicenantes bacterium]
MKKTALLTFAMSVTLVTAATLSPVRLGAGGQVSPEVRAKAAGILDALKKIEAERRRPAATLRSLMFSEAEFNAYVVCRLDAENEPFVKAAEFKLLADDRVEGRITIDLGDRQTSGLLPRRQDLLFSAGVETRDGKIKISMDKLFLGTQPIAPAVVDVIIGILSRLQGVEPTSLEDWYDLPPGVLRLESRPGQVVVYY